MKEQAIKFFAVFVVVLLAVLLDQSSKFWADDHLASPRFPEHVISLTVSDADEGTLQSFIEKNYPGNSESENDKIMGFANRNTERLAPDTVVKSGDEIQLGYVGLTVIPGYYDYIYARNPGAAFSFLANKDANFRSIFFNCTGFLAVFLILAFIATSKWKKQRALIFILAFILGGALGNIIDRIRLGYVIDFISWHIEEHYWPTFNVADIFVTVGVVLLLIEMLFVKKSDKKALADNDKNEGETAKSEDSESLKKENTHKDTDTADA